MPADGMAQTNFVTPVKQIWVEDGRLIPFH
jgi:hypothetical protein